MPNEIQEQLLKCLEKTYIIEEHWFLTKFDKRQEWGNRIVADLSLMFDVSHDIANEVFQSWASGYGFGIEDFLWINAWQPRKLNACWSPEMAADIAIYHNIEAEAELIAMLSEQIAMEIDARILDSIPKRAPEFLSTMKCLGYGLGEVVYDVNTFVAKKSFVSIPINEVKNERENNTYWKDWLRARQHNQEA